MKDGPVCPVLPDGSVDAPLCQAHREASYTFRANLATKSRWSPDVDRFFVQPAPVMQAAVQRVQAWCIEHGITAAASMIGEPAGHPYWWFGPAFLRVVGTVPGWVRLYAVEYDGTFTNGYETYFVNPALLKAHRTLTTYIEPVEFVLHDRARPVGTLLSIQVGFAQFARVTSIRREVIGYRYHAFSKTAVGLVTIDTDQLDNPAVRRFLGGLFFGAALPEYPQAALYGAPLTGRTGVSGTLHYCGPKLPNYAYASTVGHIWTQFLFPDGRVGPSSTFHGLQFGAGLSPVNSTDPLDPPRAAMILVDGDEDFGRQNNVFQCTNPFVYELPRLGHDTFAVILPEDGVTIPSYSKGVIGDLERPRLAVDRIKGLIA